MISLPRHGTFAPGWGTQMVLQLSQNTLLGRGIARKFMAGLVRGLNSDTVDVCLFGLNARLHMKNNSSEIKALMNPARYSRDEFAFFEALMPASDGVFVDIGANAGLFSLGAVSRMDDGTLLAFEPQAELFQRLQCNLVDLNPELSTRIDVRLLNIAVGAIDGVIDLYVPKQLGQASARRLEQGARVAVPAEGLLGVLRREGIQKIDMLKLDVEGYEDEVIMPFLKSAPKDLWPKGIIMEHCHRDRWQRDCQAFIMEQGYRLDDRDRTNLMLRLAGS